MITTSPASMRVDTRYAVDLTPITSSASISSLIRMAPSSAVAPAPTVAARAMPVTMGATRRTLMKAATNPSRVSIPMWPNDAKPWIATSEPADIVTKPMITAVPPITAIAPVPMPTSAISRRFSWRGGARAHTMSRTPMIANQPILPASSSGRVADSPYLRSVEDARGKRPRNTWTVDISHPRSETHTDGGQHHVDREKRHDAQHHGLVDRGAQTLGTAAHRQPAVAADQSGDEPEGQRLDRRDDDFGQPGDEGQRGQVCPGRHVLHVDAEQESADQADHTDQGVEQHPAQGTGQHPRNHQAVDGVDAKHFHRVDLLADGARTEVCTDGRRDRAGDHQHGVDRADLGNDGDTRAGARDVSGADLDQQDVEGEDEKCRHRHRHRHRRQQCHPQDEPALQDELFPLKWEAEQRFSGQHTHPEKTADENEAWAQLVPDVISDSRLRRCHWHPFPPRPCALRGSGEKSRTTPPRPVPRCVISVSLPVSSKADHRTVPDGLVGLHGIRVISLSSI